MNTFIYWLFFAALIAAFVCIPKKKATRFFGLALVIGALVFELFVFNFHTFHLMFGAYETKTYTVQSEELQVSNTQGNKVTVELHNLSQPIGTIKLKCQTEKGDDKSFVGTPYVNVSVNAKDATYQENYRYGVTEGQMIQGDDRSNYFVLNLSGDVTDLQIHMTAKDKGALIFESLTINETIPMVFSSLRLLLIVGGGFALYALITFPCMQGSYEEQKKKFAVIAFAVTAVLILGALMITCLYMYDKGGAFFSSPKLTYGNQITQELVDAFEAGQVSLLDTPSEELLALENPYDWSERSKAGVSYKWDHLLYEGKYYSYYGIAPVLLLFLPYHLITGFYFPTPEAVWLFGALGIFFLSLAYMTFCKLFCKRIPINMLLSGLFICQICSGVWYNFCSPLFYEIAQTAGFCFTCAGIWLLLRSGVLGEGRISLACVCLSSTCLSLAVLSRPTLTLYCIAALIPLFFGLLKRRKQIAKFTISRKRKALAAYLCAALLPFMAFCGLQMAYNYARFGSFLDFGIQYSLTINDFTRAQYHTDLTMIGFHNFLFAFPSVRPEFPFVFTNFSDLGVNGYYFIANRYAIGLFFAALPTWGYLAAVPACRALTKEERYRAIPIVLAACVLVPLGIIFSIWESGYGVRYCTDFAWEFVFGAMGILFVLYARRAQEQTKRILQVFFVLSTVVAFLCSFGLVYAYMSKTGLLESAFLRFERIFEFWI